MALYPISVRRNAILPSASFRFHLAMDTLAFSYEIPVTTALKGLEVVTSHLLEVWHARHTQDAASKEAERGKNGSRRNVSLKI